MKTMTPFDKDNDALCRGLELSQQPFEVKARPLRLRQGLDSARLSEMDNDLEIEAFLCKTAQLNDIKKVIKMGAKPKNHRSFRS